MKLEQSQAEGMSVFAEAGSSEGPGCVQALAVKLLLGPALAAMTSADSTGKDAILRSLLPTLGRTAGTLGGQLGKCALQAIWEQCR